jgi:hypothetical protein
MIHDETVIIFLLQTPFLQIICSFVKAADENETSFDGQGSFLGGERMENEFMRYNQLFALPLAAGLLTAASGLALAATSGAVAVEPTKLGLAAAAVTPAATPGYVQLAFDDSPGSYDRNDRNGERDNRDRGDRPERSSHR